MSLETPWQRITVLGIIFGFLGLLAIVIAIIVGPLSDAQVDSLGAWLDKRSAAVWGFLLGAVPSVATYLFGRRAGRKSGKTEAYSSAIATAEEKNTMNQVVNVLRQEARSHGLNVKV